MTVATKVKENRIDRLRGRYIEDVPVISTERARLYTESWKSTADEPLAVRVALAMKNVYENMGMHVDPDDRIAGYWTEQFLGIPIPIERGEYNSVLETELDRRDMVKFRVKSFAGTLSYLVAKRQLADTIRNVRLTRAMGPQPMDLGFDTMTERKINRYTITPENKKLLKSKLLPYWKGKCLADRLQKEFDSSDLIGGDMRDFSQALPANTSRQTTMVSPCATVATIQGHVIIDFETILEKGLAAMQGDVRAALQGHDLSEDERDTLRSMDIAIEGAMIYARRLADALDLAAGTEPDSARRAELELMRDICRHTPMQPPRTFREAVQASWTVKTAVEIAHPINLHCFGRMDQILLPYYERDLAAGRITPDDARELLEELLLKAMSQNIRPESNILSNFYHRYLGSIPITIGGVKPDGTDGTNALTYLFIDAASRSKAVTNVSLRVHRDAPEELLLAVADALHNGCSNLSLFNDDVNVEAMSRRGFSEEDSRDYAVMGCVEMECPGKTGSMSANAILLSRLLDMTLRNGDSQTLMGRIRNVGLKTGALEDFTTFEQFLEAFLTQARHQVEVLAKASNLRDELYRETMPAPCISAFMHGCLESRRDITQGGADYDLTGVSFINSIANVVDSLHVINKLVFEKKAFTLEQLVAAIDSNYVGHEHIIEQIEAVGGKWGNGDPEVDALARRMTTALFKETYKYTSPKGAPFVPYVISMITHTIDGRVSIATPDGRRAAMPYAASCNPYNVETNGVTGAMRSVAALDFRDMLGAAVNMKFHPSALGKEHDSRAKWAALIRTYFALGGAQLQPTVVSAEMMRAAQHDPQQHRDLIVKVGGYSAYFTELGIEIQNEIISRTEHHLMG
jgi:formate C-acetyltransferase